MQRCHTLKIQYIQWIYSQIVIKMTLLERELGTTANSSDCVVKTTKLFTNLCNKYKDLIFCSSFKQNEQQYQVKLSSIGKLPK